ncbi:L-shaped tail fiber protein assembly [Pelagibacter phage HTVC008M]|jgi:hypothetical protein|uniref:L-shaped tail fiber protein assembly n=1 Tax=Pelagibacter phage HTVC008M TaxID=1283076 RepID=UPI0002B2854E|nr:L-shaped tail fiber protein assembly [Pelagibacter phage HTVC008M]AGE60395.1 hypothetical protein [Pelagibacter phage HTVC008M]|tara:strand:- start:629 stop:967 length:339 start_codon:yes stop_codon:yes gene_type:complete
MAAITNLLIEQGANFSSTITLFNDDDTVFNLTDYTAAGQIRKSYSSSSASATFSIAFSADRSAGQITLSLTPTQTAALEEGRYVYDIEVTSSDSVVTRVIQGTVTVSPNVTR